MFEYLNSYSDEMLKVIVMLFESMLEYVYEIEMDNARNDVVLSIENDIALLKMNNDQAMVVDIVLKVMMGMLSGLVDVMNELFLTI